MNACRILTAEQEKVDIASSRVKSPQRDPPSKNFLRAVESEKDVTFYTGFPHREEGSKNVSEFLVLVNEGENINYWHSQSGDFKVNESCGEDSPWRAKDEFVLTLCSLKQGFREEHLSNLYNIS